MKLKDGTLIIDGKKGIDTFLRVDAESKSIKAVVIKRGVRKIEDNAFSCYESLTSVKIPKSVTKIGKGAFSSCVALASIEIPDSVTEIGEGAFFNCSGLADIEIPDSVTKIGKGAFWGCVALTSIEIPDSVTEIGEGAFSCCRNLATIAVSGGNTRYESADGVLFDKEMTKLVSYPENNPRTEYIIPNSVTKIGDNAFLGCESLISIKIPDSVTEIGEGAFLNCGSLEGMEIPDSITKIEEQTFFCCKNLVNVKIPNSVTKIGESAFLGCERLASISIPGSVAAIGNHAFTYCDNLTDIHYGGTEGAWKKATEKVYDFPDCVKVRCSDAAEGQSRAKNILIVSASPRKGGNSDILCDRFAEGAAESGHNAEKIFLSSENIGYCRGCGVCNDTHKCVQKDDMAEILDKMVKADVIVLATPVYFYSVNGQMKNFIDRTVPRYTEIKNKDFYFIMTAADTERESLARTMETFRGFTEDCLDGAREAGVIYGTGAWKKGEIKDTPAYDEAYEMGKRV